MTEPGESDITLEDLREASFILGASDGPEKLDIDPNPIVDLLRETEHLWDGRDRAEVGLWAIMIGVLAERHRLHRLTHLDKSDSDG